MARGIIDRAGKDGKVTAVALVKAAEVVFEKMDRNRDGKLDSNELTQALNDVMPRPGFGPPGGPPAGRPGDRPSRPGGPSNEQEERN
jgi:hypothetical protein